MSDVIGAGVQAKYLSPYGGFWTDTEDAAETLDALARDGTITDEERASLEQFITHGYAIIPGAVGDDVIAQLLRSVDDVLAGNPERKLSYWDAEGQHRLETATREHMMENEAKLLDLHWVSGPAQQAMFAPKIRRFLELVFGHPAIAFQCLYFERGSEQGIHQDTAFVPVADAPLEFIASWIALEDVQPGTGELLYVPGSHRLPDLMFENGKRCSSSDLALGNYEQLVRENYTNANMTTERFLPKKGDVLLWAADLCHGGARIDQKGATRRSIVTHYCPKTRRPLYAGNNPEYVVKEAEADGYVISLT